MVGQLNVLSDWELWACALTLERRYGQNVATIIAKRISELAVAGDHDGVANWKIIASRIDQLKEASWV
ncbi:MAG: hypothetical protein JWL66_1655 [Sphingomonadales bacterium]|nr:hypothetical protein [Sphingomonadales bacterium]